MYPLLSRALDRLVIRLAANAMPPPGQHQPHMDEAVELLQHPDFFCDFIQSPNDLRFVDDNKFQFRSAISTPWDENNLVHGKLFCCSKDWQKFPSVILLHGWNDELGYQFRFPYVAKNLMQHRMNCAVIELPYHMQRRPHQPGAIKNFISEDLFRMVEATRQSIADTRALINWLGGQSDAPVGLWGSSLGAWLGGLITCAEPRLNISVLTTPVAELERGIGELAFCAPIRRSFDQSKLSLDKLNLISHRPKVPRDNILIQEGTDDMFMSIEPIERFWEAWGKPEIWRLRHGHISILMSPAILKRTVKWIAGKFGG